MPRIITPDEFYGVVNLLGLPDKVKLSYLKNDPQHGSLPQHLGAAVGPDYALGRVPAEMVMDREGAKNPGIFREFYRRCYDEGSESIQHVVLLPDSEFGSLDLSKGKPPENWIALVKFLAARWGREAPHLPSIVLTPQLIKVRHRGEPDTSLEILVNWANKAGIHVDAAAYEADRDFKEFYTSWDNIL